MFFLFSLPSFSVVFFNLSCCFVFLLAVDTSFSSFGSTKAFFQSYTHTRSFSFTIFLLPLSTL